MLPFSCFTVSFCPSVSGARAITGRSTWNTGSASAKETAFALIIVSAPVSSPQEDRKAENSACETVPLKADQYIAIVPISRIAGVSVEKIFRISGGLYTRPTDFRYTSAQLAKALFSAPARVIFCMPSIRL